MQAEVGCKGLPHSAFSCVTISVFTSWQSSWISVLTREALSVPKRFAKQHPNVWRYCSSEQCEVSDPDEWAVIHYGRATVEATDNESTDGVQKFSRIPKPMESIFQLAPHDAVIRTRHQNLVSGSCAKPVSPHRTPIEVRSWTITSPKGNSSSKVWKVPAEVGWKHWTHSWSA